MRLFAAFALALLLCLSAAGQDANSSEEELMASALQTLVAGSSANLESYRFFLDIEQDIDLVNLSTEEAQKLVTKTFGFGAANMTDRALKLSLVTLSYDQKDWQNTSTTALEEYLVNDTIYMKLDGNWTSLKLPSVAEAWSRQTTMDQQLKIINQSRLTLLGSEVLDGQDCFMVRAEMDMGSMADQLSKEAESLLPILDMNYSEIFSNASLDAVYWIAKDAHRIQKAEVLESLIINPQSLGRPVGEFGQMEMRIHSKVNMLFQSYNESVAVELPSEALQAPALSAGLMASGEAVPVAQTTNESAANESAFIGAETYAAPSNEGIQNQTANEDEAALKLENNDSQALA